MSGSTTDPNRKDPQAGGRFGAEGQHTQAPEDCFQQGSTSVPAPPLSPFFMYGPRQLFRLLVTVSSLSSDANPEQ